MTSYSQLALTTALSLRCTISDLWHGTDRQMDRQQLHWCPQLHWWGTTNVWK